jgi:hypothetical protein
MRQHMAFAMTKHPRGAARVVVISTQAGLLSGLVVLLLPLLPKTPPGAQ